MWAAHIAQWAVQEVVYQRAQDAQTAIRKYNDVPLDGFNMVRLFVAAQTISRLFVRARIHRPRWRVGDRARSVRCANRERLRLSQQVSTRPQPPPPPPPRTHTPSPPPPPLPAHTLAPALALPSSPCDRVSALGRTLAGPHAHKAGSASREAASGRRLEAAQRNCPRPPAGPKADVAADARMLRRWAWPFFASTDKCRWTASHALMSWMSMWRQSGRSLAVWLAAQIF